MLAFGGHGGTFGAAAAVAFTTCLLGAVVVLQQSTPLPESAFLTVYEGTASVAHTAAGSQTAAHSGDRLATGATLQTGDHTKASLTYPNLAQARLDSDSELHLNNVSRGVGGAMTIDAFQPFGKTWNALSRLAEGSNYVIHAPNSTTAEVRGTEFEVIVEIVNGVTIVRINVFSGIVAVTANGVTVVLRAGESTTITSGEPPAPAAPITQADRQDSFTVFNETLDKTQGVPVSVAGGHFSPPESTGLIDGPTGDGSSDLEFTLGWPGSKFQLDVYRPDGTLFADFASGAPPIFLTAYQAEVGVWKYRVTDIMSQPQESWWVIVTRITPSRLSGQAPAVTTSPVTSQGPTVTAPVPLSEHPAASPSPSRSSVAPAPASPSPKPPSPSPSPSPSSGPPSEPPPSPSPQPSPSPSPVPSDDGGQAAIRGDGAIAATGGDAAATCASASGSRVRFKLRPNSVSVDFSTLDSCTPGQTGSRKYDVTSSERSTVSTSGGSTVLVFRSLNITDGSAGGKAGRIVVECSRWTLRVVVSGTGPRAVAVGFTLVDGDGKLVWTSGLGKLVEGSVGTES